MKRSFPSVGSAKRRFRGTGPCRMVDSVFRTVSAIVRSSFSEAGFAGPREPSALTGRVSM